MPALTPFLFCFLYLATLVHSTKVDSSNTTIEAATSYPSPSLANTTSGASPTVAFISYITVSTGNGMIIDVSISSAATETVLATITTSSEYCEWERFTDSCYSPDDHSKTIWQTIYADFWNPYRENEWVNDGNFTPVASQCGEIWKSSIYSYLETVPWTSVFLPGVATTEFFMNYPTTAVLPTSSDPTTHSCCNPLVVGSFLGIPFTASPPCCGVCAFSVRDAQVYQWPATDQPPVVSTLVNQAGYTFIYPSVYVEFDTLAATNTCGELGTGRGGSTIGFNLNEISTDNAYFWNSQMYGSWQITPNYTQVNPATSMICLNVTTTLYKMEFYHSCGTSSQDISIYEDGELVFLEPITAFPATYNPCSPLLSIPQRILTLEPSWKSCSAGIHAAYDPESMLTTESGFSPLTHAPTHNPETVVASAGASATQDVAIQTATIVIYPTNNPSPPQISKVPVTFTLWNEVFTADQNSAITFGSYTIRPGEQTIVSQTTISLAPDGKTLNVDGTAQNIDPAYAIGTQTIYEGGPAVTVSGTTYSLVPGGSSLVIDRSTEAFSSATGASKPTNGQKFWVPAYIIDDQTLIAGGLPITSSGTVLSLEPGGETVVIVVSKSENINVLLGSLGTTETSSSGSSSSSTSIEQGVGESSSVVVPSTLPAPAVTKTKSAAHRSTVFSFGALWLAFIGFISVLYQIL